MSTAKSEGRADAVVSLRMPPHSVQAEQSVLGGLMLSGSAWDTVSELVTAEDFYRRDHRLIFQAIRVLAEKGDPFDVVTLSEALTGRQVLEDAGGVGYLIMLAKETPSAANIAAYARIVREKSDLRQIIDAGVGMTDQGYAPGAEPDAVIQAAEQAVFRVGERRSRGQAGPKAARDLLPNAIDRIEQLFHSPGHCTGLATGFTDLDRMLCGLQSGDLIIVAGRPSMGKTSLAMQLAEHAAVDLQRRAVVFSLEMPAEQLLFRLLSGVGQIPSERIRSGKLEDDDWNRLTLAINRLAESPLLIDDTGGLSVREMRSRLRRTVRESGPVSLVVVDYLQLMDAASGKGNTRNEEIEEMTRGLKMLAKELNVPVVALSQLNRNLEQRPNKRPVMSDLRSSGGIEQDADVIAFVYRDEVHNKDSQDKGTAEIIIGKQRMGPIGTVRLTFQGEFTRFGNFAADDPYRGAGEW